jgi:cytoskeletal protein RodZ
VESLGEKLKTARKAKDISLDQAGGDTKIAVRYLQALEQEDFSCFPGEAYITGFLRNYGTYLELDEQELLSLYRALRIQAQPIPVEQLLRKPSSMPKIAAFSLLALLVLGAAGGGAYFFLTRPGNTIAVTPVARSPVEYIMNQESFEHRFYRGDSILVPVNRDQFKLELVNIGDAVTIRTPGGSVIIDLSQDANVDLDNSGSADIRISAVDYAKNNADMGVLLRFELSGMPLFASGSGFEAAESGTANQAVSTVIFTSPNPYPFTLQASFQGYCMFRWEILMERDRRDRNERYFQRADELNIQAQNGIRIWASNAQAARFNVIGGGRTVPIEIGSAGEVVVTDIRWVRDEENRFRLIIARLET